MIYRLEHFYCLLPSLDPSLSTSILEKSKWKKALFVLNKKPGKSTLHRRTLYYKIPVNFVTADDTGSTYVVPRHQPTQEESASRRSQPSVPETPLFKYSELGNENSNVNNREFNQEIGDDNPDVQAEYIRDQLDHSTEVVSPEKLSLFAKSNTVQEDSDEPSFENVKMVEPEKKCIEDECKFVSVWPFFFNFYSDAVLSRF